MASSEDTGGSTAAAAGGEAEMEVEEAELCLDLTSCQLNDLSEVEIPSTLEELDLTANRLASVDPRIGHLTALRKLSFRQNLLEDDAVAPLSTWDAIAGLQVIILAAEGSMNTERPDLNVVLISVVDMHLFDC
jgi:protein phosphatase 1 regulatory subunit 7